MRFVVLHHTGWQGRADHYDLMLQFEPGQGDDDAILKTYATVSDTFPSGQPASDLQRINDHRRAFLQFEGRLSKNRGSVSRVDEGGVDLLSGDPSGSMELYFRGKRLTGRYRLFLAGSIYCFEKLSAAQP
jgi:hypothetical protein